MKNEEFQEFIKTKREDLEHLKISKEMKYVMSFGDYVVNFEFSLN